MLFSNERTHNQERRALARRGVSDVLARENEFVVRGERQNQERRASARRGSQTAFATATVYRGVIAFLAHDRHQATDGEQGKHSGGRLHFPRMSDTRTTAGLRQPLSIRIYGCVCTVTLLFRRFVYLPRGADAPRS
jgi:hypothetical protein